MRSTPSIRLLLLLCAALCAPLSGCGGNATSNGATPNWQLYHKIGRYDGKGGLYFENSPMRQTPHSRYRNQFAYILLEEADYSFLLVNYPQGIHEKSDKTVRSAAGLLAGEVVLGISDWHAQYAPPPRDDLSYSTSSHNPNMISYEVTGTGKGAVTVNFKVWGYNGGAHELYYYNSVNVNENTGESITLDDIFAENDSITRLVDWVAGYTHCKDDSNIWSSQHGENQVFGVTLEPEEVVMERIVLTPEGLEIMFSPYEKSSFAAGYVKIRVPLFMFERLGMSKKLWTDDIALPRSAATRVPVK